MPLYLFLLLPCPFFIGVPGFHKKLHQSPYRKDFHQDGFLIYIDQPFKIFFDHRQTRHNSRGQVGVKPMSIFLAFTLHPRPLPLLFMWTSYHDILCCQGKLFSKRNTLERMADKSPHPHLGCESYRPLPQGERGIGRDCRVVPRLRDSSQWRFSFPIIFRPWNCRPWSWNEFRMTLLDSGHGSWWQSWIMIWVRIWVRRLTVLF